ncbi:MAG: DNA gyrase subunit A [Chloroflexi bacterium]|nr:DNA gyrase subunit A [Chloroflexota bacterium]MCI0580358.1 DNA gyrase subunit A [Chloroflexota bacterium]MCI0649530.1 DNA gyrase subunit A [Chloroflexota bacterium]MCI0726061.1 DNA gyrase subunit A [Chloroflexota bacterium]
MAIQEIGLVKQVNIDTEMRDSYLSYAMSVIVSRALPDARDGLKPVQRRILYAMYDMRLGANTPYKKSARVVGEVLGKYHPHGDQSVYDAMVRMAQDFSMRYPLVDGQGNFGSIDGDEAAAMRYTEARMSAMGYDILQDIDKETVDFGANFDDSLQEPAVLPSAIPNLLINGSSGIAVGMSTSIPPHNLGEVIDALAYMLDNWARLDDITVTDLMKYIKGPDFPTGALVFRYRGKDEKGESDALANAYGTGRGRVVVRAKAHVEHMERNKSRIVITELPYQVNKTNLISRIADLHREGKIEGLTDLRDESDRNGMRIIIETTRNVEPEEVLAELFRQTPMQSTFSIIMVALVNGEPRLVTLKQALRVYLDHRLEVIRRRSEYELARARERAHILEGLLIALDNLDEVIDTIRRSRTVETAKANLEKKFKLTEIQTQAILDMQLRRLAALEQRKIQEEYKEKQTLIKNLERLLSRPELMRLAVKEELLAIRERYGDHRRTQVVAESSDNAQVRAADLLPDQKVWVMVGEKGHVARTTTPELVDIPAKPADVPRLLLEANTQDILYLFTADGQAISLPVYQLPQAQELGSGTHWADMSGLKRKQHLAAAVVRPLAATGYLFMTTLAGVVKRLRLEDLPGITTEPFTVMNVGEDDALGWVRLTGGEEEVVLATASGLAIRFKEDEVRPMGLPAGGVMGIKLANDADGLVAMDLVKADGFLWSITDNGLAKASPLSEYPTQGRYGQGVINMRLPKDASEVVAAVVGDPKRELYVTMASGQIKRTQVHKAATGGRHLKPHPVVPRMAKKDRVTGAVTAWHRPSTNDN